MAKLTIALVGSLGVASQGGAANTAVTPAWGTSENRTAGNLLICWVAVTGTATLPATPTGWTIAKQQAGTSTSATVYYKIATGTDAAPTIAAIVSGTTAAQLGEFTNNTNSTTGVLDKTGGVASTTSPATATFSATDKFQPDFWVAAGADFRSAARTPNDTWTGTNITAVAAGNNNGTSSVNHYSFAYDLDTSANASADSAILTASVTTSLTGLAVAAASFTTANVSQAQAQADIKAIGRGFGQTQAKISTTRQWAQAAAFINGSFFAPFTDNFNRTVVDSLGTSTNTDPWVLKNGTTANADVNGSAGTIVTSATQQIWDLNKTVISGRGLEFSGIISINKAPVDVITIYLGVVRSFTDPFPSEFISSAAISINATTILVQGGIESGIGGGASAALTPGSSYNFKLQSIPSSNSNTLIRAKIWLVNTTEPDWTETSAILVLRPSPGHIRIYVESETDANTPFIWSVDDLHSEEAFITYSGQAQASIKGTARGYAQTQADIKAVNFGFGQSNADIKAISNAFAQTQADIKAISFGFAQTQADIKAVGYGFAQSQAAIKATSFGFAQSNADIKAVSFGFGQPQSDIKAVSFGFAQAQSDIKAVGYGFGQAQADIKTIAYSFGQPQADIKAVSNGFAQTKADIKATSNGFGQVLALIPNWFSGQANALIGGLYTSITDSFTRTTSNSLGSDEEGDPYLLITGTANKLSVNGSEAIILSGDVERLNLINTLLGKGVSIKFKIMMTATPVTTTTIINIDTGLGSSDTSGKGLGTALFYDSSATQLLVGYKINGAGGFNKSVAFTPNTWYQVETTEVVSSNNEVQFSLRLYEVGTLSSDHFSASLPGVVSPGHVKIEFNPNATMHFDDLQIVNNGWSQWGQAQARIKTTYNGFGQSNTDIKAISYGFGQTQSDIKATSFGFGQALALIPNWKRGQAQAFIVKSKGLANAAALIDGTYTLPFSEPFNYSASNDLGVATNGDTWVRQSGSADHSSVDGSKAVLTYEATTGAYELLRTIASSPTGYEISGKMSLSGLPASQAGVSFYVGVSARNFALNIEEYIGIYWFIDTDGKVQLSHTLGRAGTNWNVGHPSIPSYTPGDYYNFKSQVLKASGSNAVRIRSKLWKDGNVEPGWTDDTISIFPSSGASLPPPGHIRIVRDTHSTFTGTTSIDTFSIASAWITESGQAQAKIKATTQSYGQAQADTKATGAGYGQSQVDIKVTSNGFGQSQADINATSQGYAQAQSKISVSFIAAYGQSQADIKATSNGYAQAQATIQGNVFGQTQADIKQSYQGYANTQADIKATSQGYGQTQSDIKATNAGYGQAQSDIKATNTGSGNAQGSVTQSYQAYANVVATIKATTNSCGQSQAQILTSYQAFAQAQAKINAFAVQGYGQAQGNVRFNGTIGSGQAQAKINAFGTVGCGQAQSDIKATSQGYGQMQADIKTTSQGYGQAQGNIVSTIQNFGQSQGTIKAASTASGNTNADILATSTRSGNTQADIRATYQQYGQASTWIKITSQAYGQAQAAIVGNAYGLAKADIKQTYQAYGNAQASIKTTVIGIAQAQGSIGAKSYGFGQCQGYVITTGSQAYALAQGSILTNYVACANTQAFVKKSAGYSNSQAFIRQDRIVKNLSLSDDKSLILSLTDELASTLTLSDTEEITTTASDSESVTLALSDDLLISLELSDEGL